MVDTLFALSLPTARVGLGDLCVSVLVYLDVLRLQQAVLALTIAQTVREEGKRSLP